MVKFVELSEAHFDPVKRFNDRLEAGGQVEKFNPNPGDFHTGGDPEQTGFDHKKYVFVDKSGEMRAGYYLKDQTFQLGQEQLTISNVQQPISEGTVNPRYAPLALSIVKDCLARQPFAFALGGGGLSMPVIKMYQGLKWQVIPIPFFLRLCRPSRFFKNLSALRSTPARRALMDFLAFTHIADLPLAAIQRARTRRDRAPKPSFQIVDHFENWADSLWESCHAQYPFVAVRTARLLNIIYEDPRFQKVLISKEGKAVGWAVCLTTDYQDNLYYGSLRVGTVVDLLALPGLEGTVVAGVTDCLRDGKADIVISNQLHRSWQVAFDKLGYFRAPSRSALSLSPDLRDRCHDLKIAPEDIHMTRGDGERADGQLYFTSFPGP
ncbi:MAG: hypothetical protein AAF530_15810 [Pseudomonadota bacterium]